jgi:hypothetical protein
MCRCARVPDDAVARLCRALRCANLSPTPADARAGCVVSLYCHPMVVFFVCLVVHVVHAPSPNVNGEHCIGRSVVRSSCVAHRVLCVALLHLASSLLHGYCMLHRCALHLVVCGLLCGCCTWCRRSCMHVASLRVGCCMVCVASLHRRRAAFPQRMRRVMRCMACCARALLRLGEERALR